MHPNEKRHGRTRARPSITEKGDRLRVFGFAILPALVLAGCTSTSSEMLASGRNLELNYTPPQLRMTGESCASNYFGIPTSANEPSVQQAVNNAASVSPGSQMMTGMTVHRDVLIALAYNQACVKVDGTGVRQTTGSKYLDAVRRDYDWND